MQLVSGMASVPTEATAMDCYYAHPNSDRQYPLVLMFMDIWGLRDQLFELARMVAGRGYYCLVPDLFHRHGKLSFERRDASNHTASFSTLPPEIQKKIISYAHQTTLQSVRKDVEALLAASTQWPVTNGPAGSVGFCMGGRAAFYVGQAFPDRFIANASLHGTQLASDNPISAHRDIPLMRGEVYCGFGELDGQGTPEIRTRLETAFASNPAVAYRARVHPSADHGYSIPDRDVYDRGAADTDWTEIFAMFDRRLRP